MVGEELLAVAAGQVEPGDGQRQPPRVPGRVPGQSLGQVVVAGFVVGAVEGALARRTQEEREHAPVGEEVALERVRHGRVRHLDRVPELLEQPCGVQHRLRGLVVGHPAADRVGDQRDPQPLLARSLHVAHRRQLEVAVDALGLAHERGGVAHGPAEDTVVHDLHRHLPVDLVAGDPAAGGLQADQPVARRRDPDRAATVVGVRHRHRPGGDEGTGPGRGRPRGVAGVPRVADRGLVDELRTRTEAVLGEAGLAQRGGPDQAVHAGEAPVAAGGLRDVRLGALLGGQALRRRCCP